MIMGAFVAAAIVIACSSPPAPEGFQTEEAPKKKETTKPPNLQSADASVPDASPAAACKTVPPNNKCGLDPQCGCAINETCDVTNRTTGATSCVTAGGGTLGRGCNQTGDCAAGFTCQYGACRPYCTTPRTPCNVPGTELCVEYVDDGGKPVPNLNFCTIKCDPREPASVCGAKNACIWFATYYSPAKVSDCNFAGTAKELESCTGDADCMPGLACIEHPTLKNPDGTKRLECERWCRIGVAGDCKAGFACNDVFKANAPVINGQKEGICQD